MIDCLVTDLHLQGYNDSEVINLSKIIIKQRDIFNNKRIEYLVKVEEKKLKEELLIKSRISKDKKREKKTSKFNLYRAKVDELTLDNARGLENFDKRGFKQYHIDHIISVWYGFLNNIPVEVISDRMNLRMLWHKDNMAKGIKMKKESFEVLDKLKIKYKFNIQ